MNAESKKDWVFGYPLEEGVIVDIFGDQKPAVIKFLTETLGVKSVGDPHNTPRAKRLGELREEFRIKKERIFIHTDPIYPDMTKFKVQLVASKKRVAKLIKAGVVPKVAES